MVLRPVVSWSRRFCLGAVGSVRRIIEHPALCGTAGEALPLACQRQGSAFNLFAIRQPLARTVEDCALMLQTMAGYEPCDQLSADELVPDYMLEVDWPA